MRIYAIMLLWKEKLRPIRQYCLPLLVIMLLGFFQRQCVAQEMVVEGTVHNNESKEVLPNIHIYTSSGKKGTVSNSEGKFIIAAMPEDTLVFSSVGFELSKFHVTSSRRENELVVYMQPKTYQLEEIEVRGNLSYSQFKQQIIDLDVTPPQEGMSIKVPSWYKLPLDHGTFPPQETEGFGVKSSLHPIYDKDKMRRDAYLDKKNEWKEIDRKYNLDVVQRVTQLSLEEANEFMKWCKFEDNYILQTSEYDLAVAMMDCLESFRKREEN